MKVLAVSDTVNRLLYSSQVSRLAGGVDIIISCGDLPAYYLDFLVSTLGKPLFYICGNHDHYGIKKEKLYHDISEVKSFHSSQFDYNDKFNFGGKNLDKKLVNYKDAVIAGLEGSYLYNFGEHQYSEKQMKKRIFKLGKRLWWNNIKTGRNIDVLITHAPPRGIHDKDDLPHRGFEVYLDFIEKYKPKYLLHGHTHLYDRRISRMTEYKGTQIINCYDYQILELDLD